MHTASYIFSGARFGRSGVMAASPPDGVTDSASVSAPSTDAFTAVRRQKRPAARSVQALDRRAVFSRVRQINKKVSRPWGRAAKRRGQRLDGDARCS